MDSKAELQSFRSDFERTSTPVDSSQAPSRTFLRNRLSHQLFGEIASCWFIALGRDLETSLIANECCTDKWRY